MFLDNYDVELSDDKLELPEGDGDNPLSRLSSTADQRAGGPRRLPAHLRGGRDAVQRRGRHAEGRRVDGLPRPGLLAGVHEQLHDIPFDQDGLVVTIAFVPDDVDVVMPTWAAEPARARRRRLGDRPDPRGLRRSVIGRQETTRTAPPPATRPRRPTPRKRRTRPRRPTRGSLGDDRGGRHHRGGRDHGSRRHHRGLTSCTPSCWSAGSVPACGPLTNTRAEVDAARSATSRSSPGSSDGSSRPASPRSRCRSGSCPTRSRPRSPTTAAAASSCATRSSPSRSTPPARSASRPSSAASTARSSSSTAT